MWNHWVARTNFPLEPFKDFETARWTWTRIGSLFPDTVSAVLMPNHFHLILPSNSENALRRLRGLIGSIARIINEKRPWQPIPPPSLIPDRQKLYRQIRYVALNPCRKKLCADPLEWYWSSHREVIGATVERLESVVQMAALLCDSKPSFRVRFHAYVSSDPSVSVSGTPLPKPAEPGPLVQRSLGEILSAAASALRVPISVVQKPGPLRPLFIHLAHRHGWRRQPTHLAKICDVCPHTVNAILRQSPPYGIEAGNLCLGDPRLRRGAIRQEVDSGFSFQ